MKILAIDPGPHCGYVMGTLDEQKKLDLVFAGTYVPANLEMVWTFFKDFVVQADVYILEDFRTARQLSKEGLYTIQALGVLTALGQLHCEARLDRECVALQLPSAKKPFAKTACKMLPRQGPHAQDALAHLLHYLYWRNVVPPSWLPIY